MSTVSTVRIAHGACWNTKSYVIVIYHTFGTGKYSGGVSGVVDVQLVDNVDGEEGLDLGDHEPEDAREHDQ